MEKDQIFKLNDRGVLYINGKDAKEFLQNIVTNDMNKVTNSSSYFSSLLTPQGKYLFDFIIVKHKQGYLLDCEKNQTENLFERLNFYKLSSNIEILNLSNEFTVAVLSKEKFLALDGAKSEEGNTLKFLEDPIFLDPRSKELGARILMNLEKLDITLKKLNLKSVDPNKYYNLSHKLGIAQINTDKLKNKIFGIECNFEELNAIDFKKGCYVGQENTSRMKLRNKVRRRLLPITTNNKVSIDSEILFEDQKIGKVLIDTPYPFALIKLFDPEFAQFSDKDLINGGLKLKLLKPFFFRS